MIHLADPPYHIVKLVQHGLPFFQQDHAGIGDTDTALIANKERASEVRFQFGYLLAECRLRDMQRFCRPAEIQQMSYCHKIAQMTQIHNMHSPYCLFSLILYFITALLLSARMSFVTALPAPTTHGNKN